MQAFMSCTAAAAGLCREQIMNFSISPPGGHCCDSTVPLIPGDLSSSQAHMPAPFVSPDSSGHYSTSRACQLSGSGSASGAGAATRGSASPRSTAPGAGAAVTMGAATGAGSVSSMGTDPGPDSLEAKPGCAGSAAGAARRAMPVHLPNSELIRSCSWGMQRTYLVYGCPDYTVALAQARRGKSAMYCEPVSLYAAPTGTGAVTGAGSYTHSVDPAAHQTIHKSAHQTAHQTVHQRAHQIRGSEPSHPEDHLPGTDAQGQSNRVASAQAGACTTAAAMAHAAATDLAVGPVPGCCGTDRAYECSDAQWMLSFEHCWGKAASICSGRPDSRTQPGPVKQGHSQPPERLTGPASQSTARRRGSYGAGRSAMRQLCLFDDDFDEQAQSDTAKPGTSVMGESRSGDQAPSLLPESHAAPGQVTLNSSLLPVCREGALRAPGPEGRQIHTGATALKAQESYTAVLSYTLSSCSAQSWNDDSELPWDTGSRKSTAGSADGSGRHQETAREGGFGSRPGRDYSAQRGGPVTGEIGLGREAVFMRTALMPGYLVSSQNMPGRPGSFHGWSAMTARVPLDPERSVLGSDEESLMYAGSGFTVERNVISRHGLPLSARSFNARSRLQRARIEIELPAFVVRG